MANIAWLNELSNKDVSIAGGKGASLAEMYNFKLPVPPAFIITAEAFKKFLEQTGIKNKIFGLLNELDVDNTKLLEMTSEKIKEIIVHTNIPDNMKEILIKTNKFNSKSKRKVKSEDSDQ